MTAPSCHRALRRFWFPLSPGLGIGVTAPTEAEARELAEIVRARYHPEAELLAPIVDVDVSRLDADHVLKNMGPTAVRGVWFPALNV